MVLDHEPLDAVVWVADDCVFDGLSYGVRLAERLSARGLRVASADLTRLDGRPPPPAALHVFSGGGTSVNDRSGWMPAGLALVRSLMEGARQGEHSVLGVCLGSQMIAEVAWRGSVRASTRIEAGLAEVDWHGGERLVVPAFHYEAVVRSRVVGAPGATLLAENAQGGVQGFRLGERILGVQFHPELAPADVRRLVDHHAQTIDSHRNSREAALRSVAEHEPDWRPEVFDQVLAQLPLPDPAT